MPLTVSSRRTVHQGAVIRVEAHALQRDANHAYTLDLVVHPGAAAVVAIDPHNQVILVRQYRYGANATLLEVPAGLRDNQEAGLQCAQRELEEEAGVVAEHWTSLGSVYTSPGFCDEKIELFLAEGLRMTQQRLDPEEELEVVRMSFIEAVRRAQRGLIEDAKTAVALLRAHTTRADKLGGL